MTVTIWPVLSSNSLESVMVVDVGDGKLVCLVRRRVRKQSMHIVYGLVFQPRGPSLYRWNCFLQIGHGDCFNGLAGEELRENERQFLLIMIAFWHLEAETTDTLLRHCQDAFQTWIVFCFWSHRITRFGRSAACLCFDICRVIVY